MKCRACPRGKTTIKSGASSHRECIRKYANRDANRGDCMDGYGTTGVMYEPYISKATPCTGSTQRITTPDECKKASEINKELDRNDVVLGYAGTVFKEDEAYGYYFDGSQYFFNKNKYSRASCKANGKSIKDGSCICKLKQCHECPIDTYGKNSKCIKCKKGTNTYGKTGQYFCSLIKPGTMGIITQGGHVCEPCPKNHYSPGKGIRAHHVRMELNQTLVSFCNTEMYKNVMKHINEQKEKQNDLSIKNSRLWQKSKFVCNTIRSCKNSKQLTSIMRKRSVQQSINTAPSSSQQLKLKMKLKKLKIQLASIRIETSY